MLYAATLSMLHVLRSNMRCVLKPAVRSLTRGTCQHALGSKTCSTIHYYKMVWVVEHAARSNMICILTCFTFCLTRFTALRFVRHGLGYNIP
jgi:hypothetical protein